MTKKEEILRLVRSLPDSVTIRDVMEAIYVSELVARGANAEASPLVTHEEAKERFAKWMAKLEGMPRAEG